MVKLAEKSKSIHDIAHNLTRLFSQQAFLVDGEQNHFLLDTNRPFCHGSRV